MIYGVGRGEAVVAAWLEGGEGLAAVVGHRGGAGAYAVGAADLHATGESALRWLAGEVDFAAFVGALDVPHEDPRVEALRRRVLAGRVEEFGCEGGGGGVG